MKRDLELTRQLLLDIEARGADCSVSVLRPGTIHDRTINHESEERIRYHLRLLIDGGFLKEVDRTTAGVPCIRLTHEGHELLELSRHEPLWREAVWLCQERTGGESLGIIRTFLLRLAVGTRDYHPGARRASLQRPRYLPATRDRASSNHVRYVRVRPATEEIVARPLGYLADYDDDNGYDMDYETPFPSHLI